MKILIATPLYPPDIAGASAYVKELALRLARDHTVTVIAYNHLPEEVPGVRIIPIEKRDHIITRVIRFTRVLFRELKDHDIALIENGPSVELPAIFVSLFTSKKLIFHLGDIHALEYAKTHRGTRTLLRYTLRMIPHIYGDERSAQVLSPSPIRVLPHPTTKPEILPLLPEPTLALKEHEDSWHTHLTALITFLHE